MSTWVCMDCAARNPNPGNCVSCGQGPLLDARDAQVRTTLVQQDSEGARARQRTLMMIAAATTTVVGAPVFFFLGLIGPLMAVGLGAATYGILRAAFPYKQRFSDFM
jgi:hypothetical protein